MTFLNTLGAALTSKLQRLGRIFTDQDVIQRSISQHRVGLHKQHTNPERNKERKSLKVMGRRQYRKNLLAGRRLLKAHIAATNATGA